MGHSSLDIAKNLIKRRRFDSAINILESCEDIYAGDFEYYLSLGIAYLYADVPGKASQYFRNAREIKIKNSDLLLGQAVIFLRHGETARAIEYYLDVLEIDPGNLIAKSAMEFIRQNGDYTTICKWVDSGEIKKFYPPLGINPDIIRNCLLLGFLLGIFFSILVIVNPFKSLKNLPTEIEAKFTLTAEEIKNPLQSNLSEEDYFVNLKANQVTHCFNLAKRYFAENRDNAAQVEVNKILNSPASTSIKSKAAELSSLFKEPTFSSLKDNFSYKQVFENPFLYDECYVLWDGSAANIVSKADGNWSCSLLVNYIPSEKKYVSDGTVQVDFDNSIPESKIDLEKPVRLLLKIKIENGNIYFLGKGIHQQLKGNSLTES